MGDEPVFPLRFSWWSLIRWPFGMVRRLVSRARFLFLTPEFIPTQLVFDRRARSLFSIRLRDRIDLGILRQVYGREAYGLRRLRRHDELIDLYRGICAQGRSPLILDLGANSGIASKYFAQIFPEAKIVAVEPAKDNLEAAHRNLSDHPNVSILEAAVAGREGRGRLIDPRVGNWGYRTERDALGELRFVTVPALLEAERDSCSPFVVKIDIEGFESDLFACDTDWIDEFPLLIIELHDWLLPGRASSRTFLESIARRERDFVLAGENVFSIAKPT